MKDLNLSSVKTEKNYPEQHSNVKLEKFYFYVFAYLFIWITTACFKFVFINVICFCVEAHWLCKI